MAAKPSCRICLTLRVMLLSVLLGGAAGFGTVALGGSSDLSMAATFGGAILPVLWFARRNRVAAGDE